MPHQTGSNEFSAAANWLRVPQYYRSAVHIKVKGAKKVTLWSRIEVVALYLPRSAEPRWKQKNYDNFHIFFHYKIDTP
jgi:hypothetical protein